jgi:hypothetical protein
MNSGDDSGGQIRLGPAEGADRTAAADTACGQPDTATADLRALISRPALAVLAAAQMAALVFGGWLVALSQPAYHALGSAPEPTAANVIVIFRADATVDDVRDTLKAAGASIVNGPTDADAYLLHVDPKQRKTALSKLQADDDIQLAQPVDGGTP